MCDYFQILCIDHGCSVGRLIIRSPKLVEVLTQSRLRILVERAKRFLGGNIIKPKMLDNFSGRERKNPVNVLKPSLQLRDAFTEPFTNNIFHAPKHRRGHARRQWKMRRRSLKHPSDEAARRPVGHRDKTTGTANSL